MEGQLTIFDYLPQVEAYPDFHDMTEKEMAALAKLPNKLGMVSMLLSVLQAPVRGLAVALNAVSEQK